MITRNKIWDEIKEADVFSRCAMRYASVQRKIQFAYKIAIPVLAALCALFSKLNMPNYTFWSAILLFVSSIIKAFFSRINLSELNIDQLDRLGVEFEKIRTKDECLMDELDKGLLIEEEAIRELNKHSREYSKKKSELNKLILWIPSGIKKSLQKESEDYLKGIHYNQYQHEENN